jgi:sulfite reductase (NADPH) flavoprotein alpha-component
MMEPSNETDTAAWAVTPLPPTLAAEARQLIARLDQGQRLWLSGFLAGASNRTAPLSSAPGQPKQSAVTILYGSQSGNSERLAQRIGAALTQRGVAFTSLDMIDCRKNHLEEARAVLMVVSTHGEGDPPDRALPLHELLHGRKAPKLSHLKYSVLALGDSSYERYCETGRQFDARLAALGAERLHERVDCDVDFDAAAQRWIDAVVGQVAKSYTTSSAFESIETGIASRPMASVSNAYTRKNPFHAPVLSNQRLTARHSSKDVRHIELSLEGSSIHYEPGDAIGVVPANRSSDVNALLNALRFDPELPVQVEERSVPLREALTDRYDIGLVNKGLLSRYAAAITVDSLTELLRPERADELRPYLHGRHLIDIVREHPSVGLEAAAFIQILRPLAPRLYSIASSQRATPDEAHLTVSLVQYQSLGLDRVGVVSGQLSDLTAEDALAPIYLHRNPNFRLPAERERPVIMIGPGTGVAPFRSFLAEREAVGATSRNWLFFGDRSFNADFLYQTDWLDWRKRGILQRIDAAFSRDSAEKFYVQHRMHERGQELFNWLEDGASLYVCGDAEYMAPDVHRALLDIIVRHGARSQDDAAEYLVQLQRERRYQRDVY